MSAPFPNIVPDDGSGLVSFDLLLTESHSDTSSVTTHPVEQGVNVADHVKPDPVKYSCDVWMTNSPKAPDPVYGGDYEPVTLSIPPSNPLTQPIASSVSGAISSAIFGPPVAQMLVFPAPFDRVNDMHETLSNLKASGGTSTVITSTQTYSDMVLVKVEYTKEDAGAGTFSLDFEQILVVTSATVAAPKPIEPRGAPAKSKGSQATTPATPKGVSLGAKALDFASNVFKGEAPP